MELLGDECLIQCAFGSALFFVVGVDVEVANEQHQVPLLAMLFQQSSYLFFDDFDLVGSCGQRQLLVIGRLVGSQVRSLQVKIEQMQDPTLVVYFAVDVSFVRSAVRKNTQSETGEFALQNRVPADNQQPRIHGDGRPEADGIRHGPVLKTCIISIATFADAGSDHVLDPKRAGLEHFLEADDVILTDFVDNECKSFAFVVVVVVLDGRRPQKHIIAPHLNTLICFLILHVLHLMLVIFEKHLRDRIHLFAY